LTCLGNVPAPGSFRPSYAGFDKQLHSASSLQTNLLPRLPRIAGTPSLATAERWFERVWIDHARRGDHARHIHPSANMPDYGRNLASRLAEGYLMLMVDFTPEQKETLLIRLVQIGIDVYGLAETGYRWDSGGGHSMGRKWPILFAGIMLDDQGMKAIGTTYSVATFDEQRQTYYGQPTTDYPLGKPLFGQSCSGPGPNGNWCNTQGSTDCRDPNGIYDGCGYRTCCTGNAWLGHVLAARIMGAKALWNYDALFDYQDRYMNEMGADPDHGVGDWQRSWSNFCETMWDTYRGDYP